MYLSRLELHGFKSFAEKSTLDFQPGITAVVGPNGSGKSNIADAIRWVLGEQSTKLLRGKKAEDVIFSGSEKRSKSGFAEVTMHFNNEDHKVPLDLSEISLSRRIYRDGESEYLINKSKVRLTDVQLLLAQAQIGAKSYSIIGQGMADHILNATPEERKAFFDEAAGVRQYQIKRDQSHNKLTTSKENIAQAEMLIIEIEPRLKSLARQVERLQTRAIIEEDLHALRHAYYSSQWHTIAAQYEQKLAVLEKAEKDWKQQESTINDAKSALTNLRNTPSASENWKALQTEYEELINERHTLEREMYILQSKLDVAREVQKQTRAPLPLSKIISEVGGITTDYASAVTQLKSAESLEDAHATIPTFESAHTRIATLRDNLENPVIASEAKQPQDPKILTQLSEIKEKIADIANRAAHIQLEIRNASDKERKNRDEFLTIQRNLEERLSRAHALERMVSDARVELARIETRRETLLQEMSSELGENTKRVISDKQIINTTDAPEAIHTKIQKLKYQLELIGGIDPEVTREYQETKKRHDFLTSQVSDLNTAINDLEHVIAELDNIIAARSKENFSALNHDFNRFFKTLFGGGSAELVEVTKEQNTDDNQLPVTQLQVTSGIEIHASPPGKKIKNIAMLSGGERSMIAIALISAIMVSNPSPFVILDEVDAALDESNADKFASIISELSERTQFIVITHNRYTMKRAAILYGVTMRTDGTSQLLSVNLTEAVTKHNLQHS
jgi:chromosome segregation protein